MMYSNFLADSNSFVIVSGEIVFTVNNIEIIL